MGEMRQQTHGGNEATQFRARVDSMLRDPSSTGQARCPGHRRATVHPQEHQSNPPNCALLPPTPGQSCCLSPCPPASRSPHTQSNINCTPSRWWGRRKRVSMLSTTTGAAATACCCCCPPPASPSCSPAAAAAADPSAPPPPAAAKSALGSQRTSGSMPGGSPSSSSAAAAAGGCGSNAKASSCCWEDDGSSSAPPGCTKGFDEPQGTKCLRARRRLRRA